MTPVSGSREPPTCAVCQEPILPVSTVSQLDCGHKFHTACLNPWVEAGRQEPRLILCPLDRRKIQQINGEQFVQPTIPTHPRFIPIVLIRFSAPLSTRSGTPDVSGGFSSLMGLFDTAMSSLNGLLEWGRQEHASHLQTMEQQLQGRVRELRASVQRAPSAPLSTRSLIPEAPEAGLSFVSSAVSSVQRAMALLARQRIQALERQLHPERHQLREQLREFRAAALQRTRSERVELPSLEPETPPSLEPAERSHLPSLEPEIPSLEPTGTSGGILAALTAAARSALDRIRRIPPH
jgi:hypothetical protein